MRRLLATVLLLTLAACSTMSPRAQLVVVHQSAQTLLAAADDSERILCSGSKTMTATPTVCTSPVAATVGLTSTRHMAISRAFIKAYRAQLALNAVIETWTPGQPVDMTLLIEAVAEIDAQLKLMDIQAPNLSRFLQDFLKWKAEIERLRKLFGLDIPTTAAFRIDERGYLIRKGGI